MTSSANASNSLGWRRPSGCSVCGESRFHHLYDARDPHYGNPGTYPISECRNCGLIFLDPAPAPDQIPALYPEGTYYAHQPRLPGKDSFKAKIARWLLSVETKDPHFDRPGKMLDVGCGSGWFLHKMRDSGWSTVGVEPSSRAAEAGRSDSGLDIKAGTLHDARLPDAEFDYVRLNHSFEHIWNPNETLDEIHRVMKADAKLFIGVPNTASLTYRIFRENWYYLGAPVHIANYNPRTLTRMLNDHGFEIESIGFNSNHFGILGSLQILVNRGTDRKSDEGWLAENRMLRVLCYWIAKCLDLFQKGDCMEIVAVKR